MKHTKPWRNLQVVATFLMITAFLTNVAFAQTKYASTTGNVKIEGTSSLHDWNMSSKVGNTQATFTVKDGKITEINALSFTVDATTLKSNRSGLDKNAYKALKTSKSKTITYKMTNGTVKQAGSGYQINVNGTLTIAGETKPLAITATATLEADQSIKVKGAVKFKMSNYGVKPPTVVMGTIKTGDEITLSYDTHLKK